MNVQGRRLVDPFNDFWDEFGSTINIPAEIIETGGRQVFGDKSYEDKFPELPDWADLPDDDFAYHVAHELYHVYLRQMGFPRAVRGEIYGPDSAEARIGADIEELLTHVPLERKLKEMGFRWERIKQRLFDSALSGIIKSPAPDYGSPWFFTWAIRYCQLSLELSYEDWEKIHNAIKGRAPSVSKLGQEVSDVLASINLDSQKDFVQGMVKIRDTLGLKINDVLLVLDPVTGEIL